MTETARCKVSGPAVLALFFLLELCNALPINLENSGPDSHTQFLTGLVAVLLTVCSVVLLAGCLCCQRRNGFKEFRDSPVAASVANSLDHGHVNPIANGEFTIFTPISPPHHNNNVFLANQRIVSRTQDDYKYGDIDVTYWFDGSEEDFPRKKLKYIKELGKGWFGRVVEGTAQGLSKNPEEWCPVAVRILEASASTRERVLFLYDATIYRCGPHPNILRVLGRSLDTIPLLLLQEYCAEGDLKRYLRNNKATCDKFLSSRCPLLWCYQLTSAVKFLHGCRVTHPDLAARNCQLTKDLQLKLGDYGLSATLYPEDYYEGAPAVPLRWCAPETISYTSTTIQLKQITFEGNVWSLGVTLWEICECGDQPYSLLTDDEVVAQVIEAPKVRLPRPSYPTIYTDYLYRLMQSCWSTFESRSSIYKIELMLADLMQVYEHTKSVSSDEATVSMHDFDMRWEALKPNKTEAESHSEQDLRSLNALNLHVSNVDEILSEKRLSASMNNLHGSLDNLLEYKNGFDPMESWLENVACNTGDMSYVKGLSEAIKDLDNAIAFENVSSDSSHQQSPVPRQFKLGQVFKPSFSELVQLERRTSSESETEDEAWRKKIERGAYSEKVRQKSRSVTDLMVLTHIDCSESDSETTLPSIDYKTRNVRRIRNADGLKFGSEGNLLSVQDTFQEELRKLQEERKDSLLFVPDNRSQSSSSEVPSRDLPSSPVKKLFDELNSPLEIVPAKQVYNVFSVSVEQNFGGCPPCPANQIKRIKTNDTSDNDLLIISAPPANSDGEITTNRVCDVCSSETETRRDDGQKISFTDTDRNYNQIKQLSLRNQQDLMKAWLAEDIFSINEEELHNKLGAEEKELIARENSHNLKKDFLSSQLHPVEMKRQVPKLADIVRHNIKLLDYIIVNDAELKSYCELEKARPKNFISNVSIEDNEHVHCHASAETSLLNFDRGDDGQKLLRNKDECKIFNDGNEVIPLRDLVGCKTDEGALNNLNRKLVPNTNGSDESRVNVQVKVDGSKKPNFSDEDDELKTMKLEDVQKVDFDGIPPKHKFDGRSYDDLEENKIDEGVTPTNAEEDTSRNNFEVVADVERQVDLNEIILDFVGAETDVSPDESEIKTKDKARPDVEDPTLRISSEEEKEVVEINDLQGKKHAEIEPNHPGGKTKKETGFDVNENGKEIMVCETLSGGDQEKSKEVELINEVPREHPSDLESLIKEELNSVEREFVGTIEHVFEDADDPKLFGDAPVMNVAEVEKEERSEQGNALITKEIEDFFSDSEQLDRKAGEENETEKVESTNETTEVNATAESEKKVEDDPDLLDEEENMKEVPELNEEVVGVEEIKTSTDLFKDLLILSTADEMKLKILPEEATMEREITDAKILNTAAFDGINKTEDNLRGFGDRLILKMDEEEKPSVRWEQTNEEEGTNEFLSAEESLLDIIDEEEEFNISQEQTTGTTLNNEEDTNEAITLGKQVKILSTEELVKSETTEEERKDKEVSESPLEMVEDEKLNVAQEQATEADLNKEEEMNTEVKLEISEGLKAPGGLLKVDEEENKSTEVGLNKEEVGVLKKQFEILNTEEQAKSEKTVSLLEPDTEEIEVKNTEETIKEALENFLKAEADDYLTISQEQTSRTTSEEEETAAILKEPVKLLNTVETGVSLTQVSLDGVEDAIKDGDEDNSNATLDLLDKDAELEKLNSEISLNKTKGLDTSSEKIIDKLTQIIKAEKQIATELKSARNQTRDFLNSEVRHYEDAGAPQIQFDLSENQQEIAPNSLTHYSAFAGAPGAKRPLDSAVILGASDDYSIDYYSGLKTSTEQTGELQFSSNFIQDAPQKSLKRRGPDHSDLKYSLETWDNFLDKTFDDQNSSRSADFSNFSSEEPQSLLFLDTENYKSEEAPKNLASDANEEVKSASEEKQSLKGDRNWETGQGWFLHPQTSSEEPTGQIVPGTSESYVGFSMDDEIMTALRNELLSKLPHAQRASNDKVEDLEEEDDGTERNEVFVRYNVYSTPLSPIPEETYVDSDDSRCATPQRYDSSDDGGDDDDDDDSDWSMQDNNSPCNTQSPKLTESPAKEPLNRHTPSQDSCCSNDTLFNLEELNAANDQDKAKPEGETPVNNHDAKIVVPKISVHKYVQEFLNNERHDQLKPDETKSDGSTSSDVYLSVSDNTYAFGGQSVVAPLNSPEDKPWKELQASFRQCDEDEMIEDKDILEALNESDQSNDELGANNILLETNDGEVEDARPKPDSYDDLYGPLTDIRFSGPADVELMTTSFNEGTDLMEEQDWDSGSDTRSSSSGEFIWREGEHEASVKALRAAPQSENLNNVAPMEHIQEEEGGESPDCTSDSEGEEEEECPEFVPSAWDKYATPTKSALRSPEKSLERAAERGKKSKAVWFKKQKYHCVYEYPREPESPLLQSYDLWQPAPDYSTIADWDLDSNSYVSSVDEPDCAAQECEAKSDNYPKNLYHLTTFPDITMGTTMLDEDFFISSSSRPFDMLGGLTSQFFPGKQFLDNWNENATPDSGVEDVTPMGDPSERRETRLVSQVQSLKSLAAAVAKQNENRNTVLGGLRHTRNKLKLDLPPSPSAFTSSRSFTMEPVEEILNRQAPTFTTFGKSRFLVQQVDTALDDKQNVSFEAIPYKPAKQFYKDDFDREKHKVEVVKGEASLLDSADEDSGIESCTLERKKGVNV